VPRSISPQRNEQPLVSVGRRLTVGVAALALAATGVLSACGNGVVKQRDDTRPEPNASTEGVRSVYPTAPPPVPEGPAVPQKSGAGQSQATGK
jgi:hypothetical protein